MNFHLFGLRIRPSALIRLSLILMPLLVFQCLIARGQQNASLATLTGRVEDPNHAAISGARVALKQRQTSRTFVATTDADGRFTLTALPLGNFEIAIQSSGFATLVSSVTFTVGQSLDLRFTLSLQSPSADVEVRPEVSAIESSKTQVSETIIPREIEELPLNGRNYLDLAVLTPAVSKTNTGNNQQFAETSAVPGTGISVAGQRNLYNSFIVDGLSANDDAADLAGSFFSEEVIREFQVVTSGGIAEFGRASAGVVNIVTQSGVNDWHGRMYGFFRNQRFDARNPLALRKDLLTQGQYGGTIDGTLRKDRTFIFGNFEQTRRNNSVVITVPASTVAAINSRLKLIGFSGPLLDTGIVPGGYDSTNVFVRVDHRVNEQNQFAARYSLYDISARNARTVGGLNTTSRGTSLENKDQTVYLSNITTLGNSSINEARFQYTHSRLSAPPNDFTGPAVSIAGVANFGTATVSPTARSIDLIEGIDNVSIHKGNHSLKFGLDFLHNELNITFPGAIQGVYSFSTVANFNNGVFSSFQQAFGAASQSQSNPNIGLFAQDEWRVRPDLTINAGLRYDVQFLPEPIVTDANNFAPRLGLAYSPGDRKTVYRASFGLYYDRIPLRATSNALQRDGSKYIVAQFSPSQPGAPVFPSVLAAMPSSLITKPGITRIDSNIDNSYSEQASLQVERELFSGASISVGYIHLRGLHLIVSRNVNVPTLPASSGQPNLGRPDPNFGNISRYESSGDSWYDGMIVSFKTKIHKWGSMRVSYTLAKSIDDTGNFFFSTPQNNFNLRDDRGLSDNDQRHHLNISGTLGLPDAKRDGIEKAIRGFQFSYIFNYASRLPFNIVTGTDRNLDTNNNDRPVGVGRNTGHGFDYASLDLRLDKKFRLSERAALEFIIEGFNVLNRANLSIPNNTFGGGSIPLPAFGQPTSALDPRQFQIGVRLDF